MPEGHTIHRIARDQTADLVGGPVHTETVQERFSDGAARLDGRTIERIEAYGKHLFQWWDGAEVLHVHLGLFGKWTRRTSPPPPPSGEMRLRLAGQTHTWDLAGAITCRLVGPAERDEHLVERHLQRRVPRYVVHELPLVVTPTGRAGHRPPDGDRDRLGREPEHLDAVAEDATHPGRDLRRRCVHLQAGQGPVDPLQRVVGLQEEVPGDLRVPHVTVGHIQVRDDELSARDLILTMHIQHQLALVNRCSRDGYSHPWGR
jgi:hypothetical protein